MGVYYRKARKGGNRIWWLSYTVSGRQIFESSHSTSKRFAEKLLAIRRAEIAEGRFNLPSSNPPRLKDWTTDFLPTVRHASTKSRYDCSIKQLLSFFGEKTRLTDISVSRIESFKAKRLADSVTPAGCNRDLAVLRRLLNLAERQRLIARNPFGQVDMLDERKTRKQPHILSFEEQAKLMAIATPHLRCLIALLVDTGLRVNCEAMKLTWKDVDFEKAQIVVRESKTMAGRRVIPLSEFCKAELRLWRELTGPEFSAFVFPNPANPQAAFEYSKNLVNGAEKRRAESVPHLLFESDVCQQIERRRSPGWICLADARPRRRLAPDLLEGSGRVPSGCNTKAGRIKKDAYHLPDIREADPTYPSQLKRNLRSEQP